MTNNYMKRHHLPKFSRHCRYSIRIKITVDVLRYAFHDIESLKEFVNQRMIDVEDGIMKQQFRQAGEVK